MSAGSSHLVEILLPKETGTGQPVSQKWFESLLKELTEQFGGATSFVRASGQGLWRSGIGVERDSIAVIEVMTEELDRDFWQTLRGRLERELSQDEIIIRAHEMTIL
jgi:hypothetical protein